MIKPPPARLVQSYYTQSLEWHGVFVLAEGAVPELATYTAAETFFNMLRYRPDIAARLAQVDGRVAVVPQGQFATALPEFAFLRGQFTPDGRSYDTIIGLGGVIGNPISSSQVDNVLSLPSDSYFGLQNVLLHEAAHLIENVGFDAALRMELTAAYQHARTLPIWNNTYAISNEDEYFASASEAFFGHDRQPDSTVNIINTRAELAREDPAAFALLVKVYGNDSWNDGDWVGDAGANTITGLATADFIAGFDGADRLFGAGGNDLMVGGRGNDFIDGGAGRDTAAFQSAGGGATYFRTATGVSVTTGLDGTDELVSVERLQFSNGTLALDVGAGETAGMAYRLYQAAFARTPDAGGLAFWVDYLDDGNNLLQAAAGFIGSNEFGTVYGRNVSNAQYVGRLYENVLSRPGEAGGVAFWLGELNSGRRDAANVLANFAESPENIAGVAGSIADGIFLVI